MQLVRLKPPDGAQVVQPPDYAMHSDHFVNVLAAAIQRAGGVADKKKILAALTR